MTAGKNRVWEGLIFQLLLFMPPTTGVVLVLMPLKLLQAEQGAFINKLRVAVTRGEEGKKVW